MYSCHNDEGLKVTRCMVRSSGAGREGVCDIDGGLVQVEGLREGLKSLKAEVRRGSISVKTHKVDDRLMTHCRVIIA